VAQDHNAVGVCISGSLFVARVAGKQILGGVLAISWMTGQKTRIGERQPAGILIVFYRRVAHDPK
jgi:hypothetical protein